jgi:ABC-type transporter Mla subunit MlaD
LLLAAGFGYFIFATAARKGWFLQKVNYQTSLNSAQGLKEGDPVMLMGFNVGEIMKIEANKPGDYFGVTIYFRIRQPYFGYVWTDSSVKAAAADFLGGRVLEVTKGYGGVPTVLETTNKIAAGILNAKHYEAELTSRRAQGKSAAESLAELNLAARNSPEMFYIALKGAPPYWLHPAESPAVTERLERVMDQIERALPDILRLTNDLARVLDNSAQAASNLNLVATGVRPAAEDLARLMSQLQGPGALGDWLLPPGATVQAASALTNANALLAAADARLAHLATELGRSLENLAAITSSLNMQVQANTNIVKSVSDAIVHTDQLVQGLKRHWLLRSAFRESKTNSPPPASAATQRAPKDPFQK